MKTKPIRDEKHLRRISEMPCCVCGLEYRVVAHHLLRSGQKGLGLKSGDDMTIPLCAKHHDALHRDGNETRFLSKYGIEDVISYARTLYYGE